MKYTKFKDGYLSKLDIDAVLEAWDADHAGHDAFNAILNEVGDTFDKESNAIRENVFQEVLKFSTNHDLASYVCEEISLIHYCQKIGYTTDWLTARAQVYAAGDLPYT
jgi:hypothetical protein